ncbi:hypothetical protein Rhe02_58930 [Rhizocola hellebori]|uniref:Uncharacterized protein n=1 Tax=Rhizocola hellebori TaxID=1392758 RepID=A0A8J3VJ87_9ACTN|nr:hypothetical protein [Rhizocola hellebori]GIH07826.1 hypothetical protein Rhe02_58930 [Rhizocola hellebori]
MIAAISRVLVNSAARRFPPDSQVRQEWLAELDFLATQGRSLHALRFAAGLTFVRPAHAPVIGLTKRTVGTALAIVAGPIVLVLTAVVVGIALGYGRPPMQRWLLLAAMLTIAGAVGWWWGRRSVIAGPVLLAFLLPFSISATQLTSMGTAVGRDEFAVGTAVWISALPVVLLVVGRMAQGRREWVAVLAGFVAWLAVLDIAIIVDFMAGHDTALAEHAPFWFIHALTGQSFGVLSLSEQLLIQETYYPHPLVIFALYAMCYTARACRVGRSASGAAAMMLSQT